MGDAGEDAPLAAWRRRLRPWLRALRSYLVIDVPALPSRDAMRDMWITLDASHASLFNPQPWTVVIEALELLDLLVRVDPVVGWELVLETAHVNRAFAINQVALFPRHELRPRYRLLLEDAVLRQNVAPVFVALSRLVGDAEDVGRMRGSKAFQPTKRLLLDLWRSQHTADGSELDWATAGQVDIKLSLLLVSELKSDFARFVIHRTRQIAIASRPYARPSPLVCAVEEIPTENSGSAPRPGRPFHLAAIDFACLDHDVTNELAYVLLDIHDRGVRLSELEIDQLVASQLHAAIASSFITAILDPRQQLPLKEVSICEVDRSRRGVQRLIITSGMFDNDAIEAICTGIAESQSLREVVFSDFGVRDRTPGQPLWWPWLAFALFGSTTCHRVESVTLDVRGFDVSDLETMRRTLVHPNLLAYLCALDQDESRSLANIATPPMMATFKQGEFFEMSRRVATHRIEGATRGFFSPTSSTFQITRDRAGEDYVEFVFPGTGVCWSSRENIVRQFEHPRRERLSPIRHIKLECIRTASQAAVVELLKLVGASIKRLTLVADGNVILDDKFMDALRRSSPQLTRLDIEGDVASLRWLVSPPEDGRARCKLESFALFGHVLDTASFLAFFQSLSARNHALTQSIRAFHYKKAFSMTLTQETSLDQICAHWSEMLTNNATLERCELDVSVQDDQASADALAARLRPHHGVRILMREALAFLSVVTPAARLTATPTTTMLGLHTEIARVILGMANIPSRRICG